MNPATWAIGRVASSFNGLGIWRLGQRVWGFGMRSASFDRALYLALHRVGLMGAPERAALAGLARPGMTVLDVGANLGLYSLLLARGVGPSGRVIAFEPDPDLCALLRANCAANGVANVEAHNLALGAAPGRMVLSRLTLNSGDNHLGDEADSAFRRPLEVEVAALDGLMGGLRPDLIKVDVQGWELKVLKGMESVLRASEAVGIYLEVCPKWLRRAGDGTAELLDYLQSLGFTVYSCATWEPMDRAAVLAVAGRLRGQGHVDVFVSRRGPPGPGRGPG
jgi:FkbM family methyltransferase